jgi:hypothetical protein
MGQACEESWQAAAAPCACVRSQWVAGRRAGFGETEEPGASSSLLAGLVS